MLFTAKTFIIVSFHLEELLEVNFAVKDALQCCICAHTEGETKERMRVHCDVYWSIDAYRMCPIHAWVSVASLRLCSVTVI